MCGLGCKSCFARRGGAAAWEEFGLDAGAGDDWARSGRFGVLSNPSACIVCRLFVADGVWVCAAYDPRRPLHTGCVRPRP